MKKIMMTLAAVAVAATMNAQVWVGGELTLSGDHTNGSETTTKTFEIAPEIGYNLSDNFAVALKLGYGHASNFDVDVPGVGTMSFKNVNSFIINPYARYTFCKAGNFSAFVDGGLNYTTAHAQGAENNMNKFGVAVVPGIAYAVSEKVGLVAHFGKGLYWEHSWLKDMYRNNSYGFNLTNSISFGAYYNF
jgi:hypothetical protein